MITLSRALCKASLISRGDLNKRMIPVSLRRGMTLRKIMLAMNKEHIGSAMFQPKFSIKRVETITPTLPIVSART